MTDAQIIFLLGVLGSLYVFYLKIKKQIVGDEEERNKPIIELNQSIIKLNSTIEYLLEDIKSLKERVSTHGRDIDQLKIDVENLNTKINIYHHE